MNRNERILMLILAGINFTHILDFMIMMPLGPQLMRIFDISPVQFSSLVASYTFSAFASGLIAAFFVDRFDRKRVLLFGYTGFIVGTLGCALAPTYGLLMMARIVAGLFGGLIGAQVLSIIGDTFPYEKRATAMGALTAAFSVASVVGVPLGLYLATQFSWHAPFLLAGSLAIVIHLLAMRFVPKISGHVQNYQPGKAFDAYRNILADKNQQRAILLSVVMMLGHFSIIPFIATYLVANVGFTEHQITFVYLLGGGLTIFTSPLIGRIADKKGKFPIYALFCTLTLIQVFLITNMPPIAVGLALVVTSFFFIVVGGRMIPMQAMVTSVVPARQRGGFMSINSSIVQLGSGLASMMAGLIIVENVDGSLQYYNVVGYIAIAFSIAAIFIARKLRPADENNVPVPQEEPVTIAVPAVSPAQ